MFQKMCQKHFRQAEFFSKILENQEVLHRSNKVALACHVIHKIGAEIGKRKPGITPTALNRQT